MDGGIWDDAGGVEVEQRLNMKKTSGKTKQAKPKKPIAVARSPEELLEESQARLKAQESRGESVGGMIIVGVGDGGHVANMMKRAKKS